jgi:hypothetical protein
MNKLTALFYPLQLPVQMALLAPTCDYKFLFITSQRILPVQISPLPSNVLLPSFLFACFEGLYLPIQLNFIAFLVIYHPHSRITNEGTET